MTRGRDANHVYVAVDTLDADCDELPDPHSALDARDILSTILATSGAEQSATATIAARQDQAASLRRLEPIRRSLYADATAARWSRLLDALGVAPGVVEIAESPDAGRLFAVLDRVALVSGEPLRDVRKLIAELTDQADPGAELQAAAYAWLERQISDVRDVPAVRNATGLDPDGQALLTQIDQLIDDRTHALISAVLEEQPNWLQRLGPEPTNPLARETWLAEIAATVAHADTTRPAVPVPAAAPLAAISR